MILRYAVAAFVSIILLVDAVLLWFLITAMYYFSSTRRPKKENNLINDTTQSLQLPEGADVTDANVENFLSELSESISALPASPSLALLLELEQRLKFLSNIGIRPSCASDLFKFYACSSRELGYFSLFLLEGDCGGLLPLSSAGRWRFCDSNGFGLRPYSSAGHHVGVLKELFSSGLATTCGFKTVVASGGGALIAGVLATRSLIDFEQFLNDIPTQQMSTDLEGALACWIPRQLTFDQAFRRFGNNSLYLLLYDLEKNCSRSICHVNSPSITIYSAVLVALGVPGAKLQVATHDDAYVPVDTHWWETSKIATEVFETPDEKLLSINEQQEKLMDFSEKIMSDVVNSKSCNVLISHAKIVSPILSLGRQLYHVDAADREDSSHRKSLLSSLRSYIESDVKRCVKLLDSILHPSDIWWLHLNLYDSSRSLFCHPSINLKNRIYIYMYDWLEYLFSTGAALSFPLYRDGGAASCKADSRQVVLRLSLENHLRRGLSQAVSVTTVTSKEVAECEARRIMENAQQSVTMRRQLRLEEAQVQGQSSH